MKRYDNNRHYRFEVTADAFEDLRSVLADLGYSLVILNTGEEFAVVVKNHPGDLETIFKQSVIHWSVDGYNGFLMTDQAAVDRATHEEAIRLINPAFENSF